MQESWIIIIIIGGGGEEQVSDQCSVLVELQPLQHPFSPPLPLVLGYSKNLEYLELLLSRSGVQPGHKIAHVSSCTFPTTVLS